MRREDRILRVACMRHAVVVTALPKTRSGKILRKVIRSIADNEEYKLPGRVPMYRRSSNELCLPWFSVLPRLRLLQDHERVTGWPVIWGKLFLIIFLISNSNSHVMILQKKLRLSPYHTNA